MGMFDQFFIENSKIKCTECGNILDEFQTKDLDNYLDSYLVLRNGQLQKDSKHFYEPDTTFQKGPNFKDENLTVNIEIHEICGKCKKFNSYTLEFEKGKLINLKLNESNK